MWESRTLDLSGAPHLRELSVLRVMGWNLMAKNMEGRSDRTAAVDHHLCSFLSCWEAKCLAILEVLQRGGAGIWMNLYTPLLTLLTMLILDPLHSW